MNDKVSENRLRRVADRRGMKLIKSRSRDQRAIDYGLYALLGMDGAAVNPSSPRWQCSWTLDQVADWLQTDAGEASRRYARAILRTQKITNLREVQFSARSVGVVHK